MAPVDLLFSADFTAISGDKYTIDSLVHIIYEIFMIYTMIRKIEMLTPVTSVENVIENIERFNDGVEAAAVFMPYARSWYAHRMRDGWLFGPSRFVGYRGLDTRTYLECEVSHVSRDGRVMLDGRVTEKILQQWADLVEDGDPRYDELHLALSELCARFGKKPNTLARISVVRTGGRSAEPQGNELVALLAAVFRGLTPDQKAAFRKLVA